MEIPCELVASAINVLQPLTRSYNGSIDEGAQLRADQTGTNLYEAVLWASRVWHAWYFGLTGHAVPEHHLVDAPAVSIVSSLATRYLVSIKNAIKYVKEQTTILSATALGQTELPPFTTGRTPYEHPGILGGGWVSRRCYSLMKFGGNLGKDSIAAYSQIREAADILMSKLGLPPPPPCFVPDEVKTYLQEMTLPQPKTARQEALLEGVKGQIEETVQLLFSNKIFRPGPRLPSLNACWEGRRLDGGCFGRLVAGFLREEAAKGHDYSQEPVELLCEVEYSGIRQRVKVPVPGLGLLTSFEEYVDREVLRILQKGSSLAQPFGIAEPGPKVRVITMEEAPLSYRAVDLQKFMHGVLKCVGPFEFIGKPVNEEGFSKRFGTALSKDELYLSGDYKGATNNLRKELSEFTFKEICKVVKLQNRDGELVPLTGTVWEQLGLIDLCSHEFVDPETGIVVGSQERGQLMGSPTSFPILCLINFAASTLAFGWSVSKGLSDKSPLIINGDDIAAICTRKGYENWSEITSACGLEKSLGKNYTSTCFLVINSMFRLATQSSMMPRQFVKWQPVPFLNQCLLLGLERKGLEAGSDLKPSLHWWDLGERAKELVWEARPEEGKRWLGEFISRHERILRQVPPGVSWVASRALGGVGLPLIGTEPVLDNRKFHTMVSLLDEKARSKICDPPRLDQSSIIEKALTESLNYFSKFFPRERRERSEEDVLWEMRGVMPEKEHSDIGNRWRLAYVLDYLYRHAESAAKELIRQEPEGSWRDGLQSAAGKALRLFTSVRSKAERAKELKEAQERFHRECLHFNNRIIRLAGKAKRLVADFENEAVISGHLQLAPLEVYIRNDLDIPDWTMRSIGRRKLISIPKLVAWRPPTEEILHFPNDLGGIVRFECFVDRVYNPRRLPPVSLIRDVWRKRGRPLEEGQQPYIPGHILEWSVLFDFPAWSVPTKVPPPDQGVPSKRARPETGCLSILCSADDWREQVEGASSSSWVDQCTLGMSWLD